EGRVDSINARIRFSMRSALMESTMRQFVCRAAIPILSFILLLTMRGYAQQAGATPQMIKVTDHVYCATGYALGNVIYIITEKSVVVVDTTESTTAAQRTLDDFRKISQLPISYIIYTHFHGDHTSGAKVFKGPDTKIIAQENHLEEMAKYVMLLAYNRRVNATQFGASLKSSERGIGLAANPNDEGQSAASGYLPPDITFDDRYTLTEGGTEVQLYHTLGETYDHLMVWLSGERVLMPGDLFYPSFPMLASPMKPDRPVAEWANSLDRIRQLHPDFLVGSHGRPLVGKDQIDTTLANYAAAIRYVHDETVKGINSGLTVEEIRNRVHLPDNLAHLPYLQPFYGRVEWSIDGIVKEYTGWYDFDPAHLNPGPKDHLYKALIEATGGADPVLKRALKAVDAGNNQLALELTEIVISAGVNDATLRQAHIIAYRALDKLADAAVNTVERNIYRGAAQAHRDAAGAKQAN
ncbi:MAG TPA: alkyl/aryl-sulfatase, partial [Blastocatellia bacterium]